MCRPFMYIISLNKIILMETLWSRYYYLHFTGERVETLRKVKFPLACEFMKERLYLFFYSQISSGT